MSRLLVAPIVEGDGEVACIRILLERVWTELLGGEYIRVLKPTLLPRGQLDKPDRLQNYVRYAIAKLKNEPETTDPSLVLILSDADEDCPKDLAPRLLGIARAVDTRVEVACVLANVEYETWFVAAAESLSNVSRFDSRLVSVGVARRGTAQEVMDRTAFPRVGL